MTTFNQLIETNPDRTTYIGSTDARIIASGDWMDLYSQKRGEMAGPDLSHVFKAQLGLATENLHRNFWRWSGARILNCAPSPQPYRVAGLPDHHATSLDGWWCTDADHVGTHADGVPFEMKHTHGANDLRTAAEFYMAQIQWQMWCTDSASCVFSIIAGNADPVRCVVERDLPYIERLVDQVDVFWSCVQEGTPPSFSTLVAAGEAAETLTIAAGSVLVDGRKPYDMSTNNEWVDVAKDYIWQKTAADKFKDTDKKLRALIPADASIVTGGGLQMKRDTRGAFRCTITEKQD